MQNIQKLCSKVLIDVFKLIPTGEFSLTIDERRDEIYFISSKNSLKSETLNIRESIEAYHNMDSDINSIIHLLLENMVGILRGCSNDRYGMIDSEELHFSTTRMDKELFQIFIRSRSSRSKLIYSITIQD